MSKPITETTVVKHLHDSGIWPLPNSVHVRISFLAAQAYLLKHGRRPTLGWVKLGEVKYKMALYPPDDADLILASAHVVLASSYQQTGNHHHGQWASDLQQYAPGGCQCTFCAMTRPMPPQTLPVKQQRVRLGVPLDDLESGMEVKFQARGKRWWYGEIVKVSPAGRGRGLWIEVLCDGGQMVKVRSASLRSLERV